MSPMATLFREEKKKEKEQKNPKKTTTTTKKPKRHTRGVIQFVDTLFLNTKCKKMIEEYNLPRPCL